MSIGFLLAVSVINASSEETEFPLNITDSAGRVVSLSEPVQGIIDAVKYGLDKTPPELSADVMDRGIVLTGGGALLRGLDIRIANETGTPVVTADRPLHSVVIGSGRCLEEFDMLQDILTTTAGRI